MYNILEKKLTVTFPSQNNIAFGQRVGVPKNLGEKVQTAVEKGELSTSFVPTPHEIVDLMVKEIGPISYRDKILEPSAGYGHIVDGIKRNSTGLSPQIDAVEPVPMLQDVLLKKGVNLVGSDILKYSPGAIYDKVIMNPPFNDGLDVLHTLHCYELLKPGGKMAIILPHSAFAPAGQSGCEKWKKDWLNDGRKKEINEYLHDMLQGRGVKSKRIYLNGIFMKSDVPDDVKTELLVVKKPNPVTAMDSRLVRLDLSAQA